MSEQELMSAKEKEEEREMQQRHEASLGPLMRKYSILALKAGAGTIRLLLEDVLNVFVQAAFLVKYWDQFQFGIRLFTMASMGAGLICSFLGPVKDLVGSCKVSRQAAGAGFSGKLTIGGGSRQLEEDEPAQPLLEESAPVADSEQGKRVHDPYDGSVLDFITEGRAEHSVAAHRVLIVNSLLSWGSVALVPVLFGDGIKGGVNAVVPSSAVLFFVLVTISSILVELWIVAHTKSGFNMLIYCGENFWKAITCKGYKEAVANGAIVLSILGRWDTFSDVVFATILCKTDVITELTFSSTLHKTIALPVPLHQISLFSVIIGVFCFQAIPGILLMMTKKGLPAAFKLNEFNFLLGVIELEAEEDVVEI